MASSCSKGTTVYRLVLRINLCPITTGSVLSLAVNEQDMDALVLEKPTILFICGWCLAGSHKLVHFSTEIWTQMALYH